MDTVFVTHSEDEKGVAAIQLLQADGYETLVLRDREESPVQAHIAVFGINGRQAEVGGSGHYVRTASHRLPMAAPAWVNTPFTIGVIDTKDRPVQTKKGRTPSTFHSALLQIVKGYQTWMPGLTDFRAPWHPNPDEPAPEHYEDFKSWEFSAVKTVGNPALADVLRYHLETPVIGDSNSARSAVINGKGKARLVIMGCAPFNAPHTDIASSLMPEKATAARDSLRKLILDSQEHVSEVLFVIAGGDFMSHNALKASLHPFFWMDVNKVENSLGSPFNQETRLWGRTGQRSDEEVAEAMEFGYALVANEILLPLQGDTELRVPIKAVRWTDLVGREIFDIAWAYSQGNGDLAQKIYKDRVGTRFWYETINRIDPNAGLRRTLGNNAVYIATILWASENRDSIIIDAEVDEQFWVGLLPLLKTLWDNEAPYVASLPQKVCQPWAY